MTAAIIGEPGRSDSGILARMREPRLSVVCVTGHQRRRLQRCLGALAAQSVADDLELVLVDLGPADSRPEPPAGLGRTHVLAMPPDSDLGAARAAGARAARADVVAFLFDHGYPEPEWAESLISAYRGSWAAVGYVFKPVEPGAWSARTAMVAQFGPWLWPSEGGATHSLPGNMVSYRRDLLRSLDGRLDSLLEIDFLLHRHILDSGLTMSVEPGAVVREECYESLADTARANHVYSEMLAVQRARVNRWSLGRRLAYGLASPVVVTALRLLGAAATALRTGRGRATAAGLPGVVAIAGVAGFGEARGYLFGSRDTAARFIEWELNAPRAADNNRLENLTEARS
jgi:hypothetical protein